MSAVQIHRGRGPHVAGLLLALAIGAGSLAACSSDPAASASLSPSPSASASASMSASPSASTSASPSASPSTGASSPSPSAATPSAAASPTAPLAPPLANPAPATVTKVLRNGKAPTPTVVAPASPFTKPVTYSDGVALTVRKAVRDVEEGHGVGTFAGRELVVLDLEFTNGSKTVVKLDEVVLTAFYGRDRQLAPTVYAPNVDFTDFGGSLAPGKSARARYALAIPGDQLGAVTLVVDFDGAHASTVFTGKVAVS